MRLTTQCMPRATDSTASSQSGSFAEDHGRLQRIAGAEASAGIVQRDLVVHAEAVERRADRLQRRLARLDDVGALAGIEKHQHVALAVEAQRGIVGHQHPVRHAIEMTFF